MTKASACYQDVDDVLYLSYVPNTAAKTLFCLKRSKSICTRYKPLAERKALSSIEVPMKASQVLTQGSLNAILSSNGWYT
jgi:hypothetical protein